MPLYRKHDTDFFFKILLSKIEVQIKNGSTHKKKKYFKCPELV